MRIAVIDYRVVPTNPVGSCHRRMLERLCEKHHITVFALEFDNPRPDRIEFIRVPVPGRPLALLFVLFHLVAPLVYLLYRWRRAETFDMVQTVESNSLLGGRSRRGQLTYSHFCHRRYLQRHWPGLGNTGIRSKARWLDHWAHAIVEPFVYRRARQIVVPSQGLARELKAEYPDLAEKIRVLPNPVDVHRMRRPVDFDAAAFRRKMGFEPADTVLAFVALGHFERKGLPLLLEAIHQLPESVKLNVVGGRPGLIGEYRARANSLGIASRVCFSGMQDDVRPHLWASDAFVLPSSYEVFPLVALEASAAGLLLISTPLNGVEEFLRDGENGFLIDRSVEGIRGGITRLLALPIEARKRMGAAGQHDVSRYSTDSFGAAWSEVWSEFGSNRTGRVRRARHSISSEAEEEALATMFHGVA